MADILATRPEPQHGEEPLPGDTPLVVHFPLVPTCDPQIDGLTQPIKPIGTRRRLPKVAALSIKLTFHTAGTAQQAVSTAAAAAGASSAIPPTAGAVGDAGSPRSESSPFGGRFNASPDRSVSSVSASAASPKLRAGMSSFNEDLDFLHALLGEDMVKNSDVKDIVGNGVSCMPAIVTVATLSFYSPLTRVEHISDSLPE